MYSCFVRILVATMVMMVIGLTSGECGDTSGRHSTPRIAVEWELRRVSPLRLQVTGSIYNTSGKEIVDLDLLIRAYAKDGGLAGNGRFAVYPKLVTPNAMVPFGMMIDLADASHIGAMEFNLYYGTYSGGTILPDFVRFSSVVELPVSGRLPNAD